MCICFAVPRARNALQRQPGVAALAAQLREQETMPIADADTVTDTKVGEVALDPNRRATRTTPEPQRCMAGPGVNPVQGFRA
jgi:hypothetical protein